MEQFSGLHRRGQRPTSSKDRFHEHANHETEGKFRTEWEQRTKTTCKRLKKGHLQTPQTPGNLLLTLREVLLVGEDEYDGVPHLAVVDDPVQLLPRLVDAVAVGAVHHEDQSLRPRVVVPPQRTDLVLPANVLQSK